MTPPLSYPALKSVLEYLEVKKRIHLTSRSSFLQRIDKAIPVYVERFFIQERYLSIDDYRLTVEHKPWYTNEEKKNGKLLMSYLNGRSSVNANLVVFAEIYSSPKIAVKLDLTFIKLATIHCNLEALPLMINPRNLPLKDLFMIINEPTNVDIEIVRSAKLVGFGVRDDLIGVEKLPNKSVRFEFRGLPVIDTIRIIRYWMQNGKEVGTEFSINCYYRSDLVEMLAALEAEFQEVSEELMEIDEPVLPGFSVPLSFTSKLLVYGLENHKNERLTNSKLILKVV